MSEPTRYEITIRGRATARVLRPALDDFCIEPTDVGTTRLVGDIRDASHLNGMLAHFASMNVDVLELRRVQPGPAHADACPSHDSHRHTGPENESTP